MQAYAGPVGFWAFPLGHTGSPLTPPEGAGQSRTMLRAAASRCTRGAARRLSLSAAEASPAAAGARHQRSLDEGDWSYHREWWGKEDGPGEGAQTVFRRHSECGNGVVSVFAYPASRPVAIASLSCSPAWPYSLC